jgi:hypothetical protein
VLEKETSRGAEFQDQLQRIEYQSDRVARNPNYDLDLEGTQKFMKEKSIHLLTAIVKYFNGALLYFNHGSFGFSSDI